MEQLTAKPMGLNNSYTLKVLTEDGIKDVTELRPGDHVYEYKTGNLLEVREVFKSKPQPTYHVFFSDQRSASFLEDDLIFTGNDIVKVESIVGKSKLWRFFNINQYPIEFNKDKVITPPIPDPYVAGPLLAFGNYAKEFINLPSYFYKSSEFINNFYDELVDITPVNPIKSSIEDFTMQFISNDTSSVITWKGFFPDCNFDGEPYTLLNKPFPLKYIRSSINDRKKFIRGIFDVGYIKDIFDGSGSIGIVGNNSYHLKEVQKILWSLGILSFVSYDPMLYQFRGFQFKLSLIGDHSLYPGLFSDPNHISDTIKTETSILEQLTNNSLNIKNIIKLSSSGYMHNIVFDEPNKLYLDDNFLPRVSL